VLYLALDRPQQAARSGRRIVSEEQCRLYQRKAQSENKKPKTISDVDRSRFLTAACGSVVMLWGQAIVQDSLDVVAIVWARHPKRRPPRRSPRRCSASPNRSPMS
jgi:hypothetical protein